jgi:hypothetical protein
MGRNEGPEPAEVVDRLLWRDAQQILNRHVGPDAADRCQWCGIEWPCPPRLLAERADEASRRPWRDRPAAPVIEEPTNDRGSDLVGGLRPASGAGHPRPGRRLTPGPRQEQGTRVTPRLDPGQRLDAGQRYAAGQRGQPGPRPASGAAGGRLSTARSQPGQRQPSAQPRQGQPRRSGEALRPPNGGLFE